MGDMITTRKEMSNGRFSIKDEYLKKTGTHPAFGILTIEQWLNFFLLHEAHHLFTIFKLASEFQKKN
jgi:Protein of unknown function (DUF1569)